MGFDLNQWERERDDRADARSAVGEGQEAGPPEGEAAAGPGPHVVGLGVPPADADEHEDEGADDGEDQKDQSHAAMLARLAELGLDAETLRGSERWLAFLRQAARFHHYSMRNRMLIFLQRPDATRVMGFRQWPQVGRHVVRNAHHIKILAPMTGKDADGTTVIFGFKVVRVFDEADTEGEPLAELPPWPTTETIVPGLYDRLTLAVHARTDLTVIETEQPRRGARGWLDWNNRTISLVTPSGEGNLVTTLLHELGHAFDPELVRDYLSLDRMACEVVAESAAYLAATELGVGMREEAGHYLASWEGDTARLLSLSDRIAAAAKAITGLLGPREEAA